MHFNYLAKDEDTETDRRDNSGAHDVYWKCEHPLIGVSIIPPIVLKPNNQQEKNQVNLY